MRVTIEHREEAAGLLGGHKNHFIDFGVEFSEEEKAIIKARDLRDKYFEIRTSRPLPTKTAWHGTNILRLLAFIAIPVGAVGSMTSMPWGDLLLTIGLVGSVFLWWKARQQNKTVENREQIIRIRDLVSQRKFTVHAKDPSHARTLDEEIKEHLAGVKQMLIDAVETPAKATFEL